MNRLPISFGIPDLVFEISFSKHSINNDPQYMKGMDIYKEVHAFAPYHVTGYDTNIRELWLYFWRRERINVELNVNSFSKLTNMDKICLQCNNFNNNVLRVNDISILSDLDKNYKITRADFNIPIGQFFNKRMDQPVYQLSLLYRF